MSRRQCPMAAESFSERGPLRGGNRLYRAICAKLLLSLLLIGGCQDPEIEFNLSDLKSDLFSPKRPPRECMLVATSESDADTRREALVRVARSDQYAEPWAVDGYVAIALLELDPQTRCVAIRALARIGDERCAETLLRVLNFAAEDAQAVRPPVDVCRADAAEGVARLLEAGKLNDGQRARAAAILRPLVTTDSYAPVRRAAARALGFIPEEESVRALIAGLRDTEFTVVYASEDALARLTGVTQRTNVAEWEAWFAANRDNPFAGAGQIPPERRNLYDGPLGKMAHDMKQTWEWIFPAAAEE